MDRLHAFATYAGKAKTPKELYQAIENLGPIPRCVTHSEPVPPDGIHAGRGLTVNLRYAEIMEAVRKRQGRIVDASGQQYYEWDEPGPAVEETKAIYAHARTQAILLRASNPKYPPLPRTETDPFLGMGTMKEWCIDADAQESTALKRLLRFLSQAWKLIVTGIFLLAAIVTILTWLSGTRAQNARPTMPPASQPSTKP